MTCFVDLVRPETKTRLFDAAVILLGSCFLALMAQIAIPLWFSPVPITLQSFAILLLAGILGSKRGVLATLLYLAEGALGLPVFAGFSGGIMRFVGPTGGYLFGFVLSVYVVGLLLERGFRTSFTKSFCAMLLGMALLYLPGILWLSFYVGGVERAFSLGLYPFLPGALCKMIVACLMIPSGWKWVNSFR